MGTMPQRSKWVESHNDIGGGGGDSRVAMTGSASLEERNVGFGVSDRICGD
jgi:hypothetical protein